MGAGNEGENTTDGAYGSKLDPMVALGIRSGPKERVMQISPSAPPAVFPTLPKNHGQTPSPGALRPAVLSHFRPYSAPDVIANPWGACYAKLPLCTQFFLLPPKDPGTHRLLRSYVSDLEQRRVALQVREFKRLQCDATLRARVEAAGQSFRRILAQLDAMAPRGLQRLLVISHTSLTSESASGVAVIHYQGSLDAARVEHLATCPEALFGEGPSFSAVGRSLLGACIRLSTMTGHEGRLNMEQPPAHATGFLAACYFVETEEGFWTLAGSGLTALKQEVNPRLAQ